MRHVAPIDGPPSGDDPAELLTQLVAARHTPLASYRLQFNHTFRFDDARRLVPYLRELGISDLYASPYLRAAPGSMHGYDIVDHNQINPEIGSSQEYERFVDALHAAGMSQLLDIVPNHMGIGPGNDWWRDVLENGPSSRYAGFFDIDWQPPRTEMANKVLLSVLGDQFGHVLDRGELKLAFEDGGFNVHYWEMAFPIAPGSYVRILQPALDRAAAETAAGDENLLELQSIITSISHLPAQTETAPERLAELYRERLIVRRRLQNLCVTSSSVCRAIDASVAELNGRPGDSHSYDRLAELLEQQAYRLSYWRVAAQEINYRRFFDVNSLAALRMERPEVFEATHRFVLELLASGKVNGLRIDHPDGLRDPDGYLRRLQSRYAVERSRVINAGNSPSERQDCTGERVERDSIEQQTEEIEARPAGNAMSPEARPLYVVVEKILGQGERLPADWATDGTTGYDFLNQVNGIFVDGANRKAFDAIYTTFTGARPNYRQLVYESKKLVMRTLLASELNVLALQLSRVAAHNRSYRDFTLNLLTSALVEIIACFSIYRTYVNPAALQVSERDRLYIDLAIQRAERLNPTLDPSVFAFVKNTLTLGGDDGPHHVDDDQADFVLKFQQVSSPVMAKGVEDTACYRYVRLVSLNDVGSDPDQFGISVNAFHRQNSERQLRRPYAMFATSTHDTKRSEDVRARLNVLSEIPLEWRTAVRRWSRLNRRLRQVPRGQPVPDPNDEYLLYQTLLGAWPLELLERGDDDTYASFTSRIQGYMEKAVREAKLHTSWINPNAAYEDGLRGFIGAILSQPDSNPFVQEALPFIRRVAAHGLYNSLSQTVLKLTSPGVPDLYQGSELWDFSLVDPDNRRPVDFDLRKRLLKEIKARGRGSRAAAYAAELLATMADGRIKLLVTRCALLLRRQHPELFGGDGAYIPLELTGNRAENAVAFLRRNGTVASLTVVPRLTTRLTLKNEAEPPLAAVWGDTAVVLKGEVPNQEYRDVFTGATLAARERDGATVLPLADLFSTLPVALAVRSNAYAAE